MTGGGPKNTGVPQVTDQQKKAYNKARSGGKSPQEARKIAGF